MSSKCRIEYKCRRCGGIDCSAIAPVSLQTYNDLVMLISEGRVTRDDACGIAGGLRMFELHACGDGGLGVSDLIGTDTHPMRDGGAA